MQGHTGGLLSGLPKFESRALKYGYSNARIKGMKGQLLSSASLNDLVRLATVDSMVEMLSRSGYKNELAQVSLELSGSRLVEVAASRNFARVVAKVIKLTPEADRPVVRALLLKWDLMNLKTLMAARKLSQDFDSVRSNLFSVGGMSEDEFRRILKTDDRDLIREVKKTDLGKLMFADKAMHSVFSAAFRGTKTFFENEAEVDANSYLLVDKQLASCGGKETASVRELLRREIDAKNVLIMERMKKRGADKKTAISRLIHGGTLPDDLFGKVFDSKDLQATANLVRYKFPQLTLKENTSLSGFEIALEKSMALQKMQAFHRAILSVGVIVGFLLLKEEEISNLRKIAKGKDFGTPENDVREMLVVV